MKITTKLWFGFWLAVNGFLLAADLCLAQDLLAAAFSLLNFLACIMLFKGQTRGLLLYTLSALCGVIINWMGGSGLMGILPLFVPAVSALFVFWSDPYSFH